MQELEYPFDCDYILKKKKSLKQKCNILFIR